jgi:hypothetical protein
MEKKSALLLAVTVAFALPAFSDNPKSKTPAPQQKTQQQPVKVGPNASLVGGINPNHPATVGQEGKAHTPQPKGDLSTIDLSTTPVNLNNHVATIPGNASLAGGKNQSACKGPNPPQTCKQAAPPN